MQFSMGLVVKHATIARTDFNSLHISTNAWEMLQTNAQ